jgi:DNA-binding transcriptional ArsR family regulator
MSRRRSYLDDWYAPLPKQPVPADGIAVSRFGDTWWGREWIASLERLGRAWSNRLPRGRSYARQGRVKDLQLGAGVVTAGVVGTRRRPYRVEIRLPAFGAEGWRPGLERLANDTLLVIRLLDRELPEEVGARLREAGVDLFPRRGELSTDCSCPDWANPCKHIAAVHYLLAAALDNDPFLLFRLRGLDRDDLIDALAGEAAGGDGGPVIEEEPDRGGVESGDGVDVATFIGRDLEPPLLDIDPRAPGVELVGLKRLGPPPRGLERLPKLVAPAVRAAGKLALELAWRDERPNAAAADVVQGAPRRRARTAAWRTGASGAAGGEPPPQTVVDIGRRSPRHVVSPVLVQDLVRRVEAALSEAGRALSKRELLAEVGAPDSEVTGALRRLRDGGLVVTSRRGPATRYRLVEKLTPFSGKGRGRRPHRSADDAASRVVEILDGASKPLPLRAIAERLGATAGELRPVILSLRQNGVVEMVGRRRSARYRLVR